MEKMATIKRNTKSYMKCVKCGADCTSVVNVDTSENSQSTFHLCHEHLTILAQDLGAAVELAFPIKQQIDRIEAQIVAEGKVYDSWKKYTDSNMKTAVINQQIGVVRGLESAKESLNYLLSTVQNGQMEMEFEPVPGEVE